MEAGAMPPGTFLPSPIPSPPARPLPSPRAPMEQDPQATEQGGQVYNDLEQDPQATEQGGQTGGDLEQDLQAMEQGGQMGGDVEQDLQANIIRVNMEGTTDVLRSRPSSKKKEKKVLNAWKNCS